MPDIHSGYGFCIGNVAAFDMSNPEAVVSPGKPDFTWVTPPSWGGKLGSEDGRGRP
jgi:hypothetical protein